MTKASELLAGPDLDALVADKVMSLHVEKEPAGFSPGEMNVWRNKDGHKVSEWAPPKYSTDRSAAMQVVDRMRADWFSFQVFQPGRGLLEAVVDHHTEITPDHYAVVSFVCGAGPCPRHKTDFHNHHGAYDVKADTLASAICRAALVALKVAEPDPEGP